jgi:formiminotetrahydrofolate cyclodeaminase
VTSDGSPAGVTADVLELTTDQLLEELGSEDAWLASGAVSALVAAMAAELVAAAARRSGGWEHALGAAAQAHALRLRAAPLSTSDARAYGEARELLAGGRTEPDAERRDYLLGRALALAAEVPLLIAAAATDVALLAADVAREGGPEARGDAAGAAVLAASAARAAGHLVEINLGTTTADPRVAAARALAAAAGAAADEALALH